MDLRGYFYKGFYKWRTLVHNMGVRYRTIVRLCTWYG